MASDNNLKVDELNFESIKSNLKSYLSSQDQFRDYNFEGSGLNVLLDLLAYNTYYNSFYLNMVAAEAFLPTAQKRNSVVNLAKSLNYTPRSTTAAYIEGTLTASVVGSPTSVTIPKYTEFVGTVDNRTFSFLTTESLTLFSTSSYVDTVTMVEGKLISRRYTVNSSDSEQRFLIPNTNVDTTTITIRVLNSSVDSTTRTFTTTENIVEVTSTSQVYFLEEAEDGQYEIKFGDGVFGQALSSGNIIIIDYIVTNGTAANDVQALTYSDAISGVTDIVFVSTDPASGGADKETVAQIKFNAPKSYEAQNRAVTVEDYTALMLQQSTVDSVAVWGGEDNDPPTYGKVFIAVKPRIGSVLTATEKANLIRSVINPKKILTVTTEIVDPEYIYILVNVSVKYDTTKTVLSPASLEELIFNVIKGYNDSDIGAFSTYFRFSKLSRLIDVAERSILNNDMFIRMRKELDVQLGVGTRYEINFSNYIDDTTRGRSASHPYGAGNKITSNAFTYEGYENCFLEDNNGLIRIYRETRTGNVGVSINAGTVDYATGKVILTNFAPTAFNDGGVTLKLTAFPQEKDVLPLRSQIVQIRDEDIAISLVDDNQISLTNR